MARYFMGTRLTHLDERFDLNLTYFQYLLYRLIFYRKVLESLQRLLERHGTLPDDLPCKNLYGLFFNIPDATPLCACAPVRRCSEGRSWPFSQLVGSGVA